MKQIKIQGWNSVYHEIRKIMGEREGTILYNRWWHSGHDVVFWQVSGMIIRDLEIKYGARIYRYRLL